jgi:hypothetical protein
VFGLSPGRKKIDCVCVRTGEEDSTTGRLKRRDVVDILGQLRASAEEDILDVE